MVTFACVVISLSFIIISRFRSSSPAGPGSTPPPPIEDAAEWLAATHRTRGSQKPSKVVALASSLHCPASSSSRFVVFVSRTVHPVHSPPLRLLGSGLRAARGVLHSDRHSRALISSIGRCRGNLLGGGGGTVRKEPVQTFSPSFMSIVFCGRGGEADREP